MTKEVEYSDPLTWNELADIYHKMTGKQARTQPMEKIVEWAEKHTDTFFVGADDCLYLKEKRNDH